MDCRQRSFVGDDVSSVGGWGGGGNDDGDDDVADDTWDAAFTESSGGECRDGIGGSCFGSGDAAFGGDAAEFDDGQVAGSDFVDGYFELVCEGGGVEACEYDRGEDESSTEQFVQYCYQY